MNDIMLNAYQDHTFEQTREDLPLFEPILEDWRATRTSEQEALATIITNMVGQVGRISRARLWERIVIAHFMQYREAEFREAAQTLVQSGTIVCEQPGSRRLNDASILRPIPKWAPASATRVTPARLSS